MTCIPDWNQYFINMAKVVAQRSKDPSSQVGCVIVSQENRPISFGYNGFISGIDETKMTNERPLKYHLVVHAEMNALIFAHKSLKGAKVYATHGPCDNCLKHLIQAQVAAIYYENPGIMKERGTPEQKEAIYRMLTSTNIICQNINGKIYLEEIGFGPKSS